MANAAAAIALTYRTADLQDSTIGTFLEIVRGFYDLPTVRGKDTVVPGLVGRKFGSRKADSRAIELRGLVIGVGDTFEEQIEDYIEQMDDLFDLFDPTLSPGVLQAVAEDVTRTINARGVSMAINEIGPTYSLVSVELESVDPNWATA